MRLTFFMRWMLPSLAVVAAMVPAYAQQTVSTNRSTELRSRPDDAATLVRTLAAGTSVQVAADRSGPWKRVTAGSDTGWLRFMHLGGGAVVTTTESSTGTNVLTGFNRLLGGSKSNEVQARSATVGVRGFGKEDVERASANNSDFEKLKRYQTSAGEAERFASQSRLEFRTVAYLAKDAVTNVNGAKGATR
jgi:hypothetical protein